VIALVTGPHRAAGRDLTEVDEPDPACNEAAVAVRVSSLLALVSAGQLDARVALTVPWADAAFALDALWRRTISSKAVLTVTE
jgi:hypothetical protein